jgi:hypothetical protein
VPAPKTAAAGCVLSNKSSAFTPRTGSENVTVIWVKLVTLPGGGVTETTTGGSVSAISDSNCKSKPKSLLLRAVLSTWTAIKLSPERR